MAIPEVMLKPRGGVGKRAVTTTMTGQVHVPGVVVAVAATTNPNVMNAVAS